MTEVYELYVEVPEAKWLGLGGLTSSEAKAAREAEAKRVEAKRVEEYNSAPAIAARAVQAELDREKQAALVEQQKLNAIEVTHDPYGSANGCLPDKYILTNFGCVLMNAYQLEEKERHDAKIAAIKATQAGEQAAQARRNAVYHRITEVDMPAAQAKMSRFAGTTFFFKSSCA